MPTRSKTWQNSPKPTTTCWARQLASAELQVQDAVGDVPRCRRTDYAEILRWTGTRVAGNEVQCVYLFLCWWSELLYYRICLRPTSWLGLVRGYHNLVSGLWFWLSIDVWIEYDIGIYAMQRFAQPQYGNYMIQKGIIVRISNHGQLHTIYA